MEKGPAHCEWDQPYVGEPSLYAKAERAKEKQWAAFLHGFCLCFTLGSIWLPLVIDCDLKVYARYTFPFSSK